MYVVNTKIVKIYETNNPLRDIVRREQKMAVKINSPPKKSASKNDALLRKIICWFTLCRRLLYLLELNIFGLLLCLLAACLGAAVGLTLCLLSLLLSVDVLRCCLPSGVESLD